MDPFGDPENVYPHGMVPSTECPNRHIPTLRLTLVDHRFTVDLSDIDLSDIDLSDIDLRNLIIHRSIRKVGTF